MRAVMQKTLETRELAGVGEAPPDLVRDALLAHFLFAPSGSVAGASSDRDFSTVLQAALAVMAPRRLAANERLFPLLPTSTTDVGAGTLDPSFACTCFVVAEGALAGPSGTTVGMGVCVNPLALVAAAVEVEDPTAHLVATKGAIVWGLQVNSEHMSKAVSTQYR